MTDDPRPDVEAQLRRAIHDRTSNIEPSTDALARIEEKLMDEPKINGRQRAVLIGLSAAAAVAALVLGVIVLGDDDDQTVDQADQTSSTSSSTSTSTEPTTPTSFVQAVDPTVPIWPAAATSQRFDDPVAAARSFAVDLVGFVDPVMGPFRQADSRSGEVSVKPRASGPVTTVIVRQLEDDTWFVIGAHTDNVRLDDPTALDVMPCPARLVGAANAFEGHVNVSIRADGVEEPVGEGFVTGEMGAMGPFDETIECAAPVGIDGGVILLTTASAEDGSITEAVAVRIAFR